MDVIQEPPSILIIGILIIEDLIAAILISTLHSSVLLGAFITFDDMLWKIAEIGLFIGATVVLGCLGMPKIFSALANFERFEFTILVALGLAFGLSFLSYTLGFSAATGAFLAGVILAGSRFLERLKIHITPTREIFIAIFFVTIGALMDVNIIAQYWLPIVIITVVTIIGKIVATYAGVRIV